MTALDPRRGYRRHRTIRSTRLRPNGYRTWIHAAMIDWSAAGASLSCPDNEVPLGPAILAVSPLGGTNDIQLACEVVWRRSGQLGLKFSPGTPKTEDNTVDVR
ncbi:PilZ domain-containing protein [Hyphomonas sp. GM-8P]|uniref:PilZ domain-containing protein n=1 Tax=unclassified Hyphomonas TaxID=2630699 RepID=UPI0009DDDD81|nr:PilZ domain-containing protein [Hyphomonas sp. GM-8P]